MVGENRQVIYLQLTHQVQVALERVKEYTDLPREPAEFMEPRPGASWPEKGEIKCENLVIRYAVSGNDSLTLDCTYTKSTAGTSECFT